MAISREQFSQQMVAQLRLLNTNFSAEIGTPERLIFDTVSQTLADSQIDLVGLENALNIDTKFGANLDNFVALFGFGRKGATTAGGFVVFTRNAPSNFPITVPAGTIVQSTTTTVDGGSIQFVTTAAVTLPPQELETSPVPISAFNPGTPGNVEAETITILVGEPLLGITGVVNRSATTGGSEQEDDSSLKVRFKNTVFRNLAGTKDQFLALSIATAFSTKANVVGPVSTYQEYIQVPPVADTASWEYGGEGSGHSYSGERTPVVTTGSAPGTNKLTVKSTGGLAIGSTQDIQIYKAEQNPISAYGKTKCTIVSNTLVQLEESITITEGVVLLGTVQAPGANEYTAALSTIPYAKNIWTSKPVFVTNGQNGITNYFFREGVDFNFNFPAKFQGDTLRAFIDGTGNDPETGLVGKTQPNVTFTNVYVGSNNAIQATAPNQVVLLEYSYTSSSSRNDLNHNITNAVDIFVDGGNDQTTSVVFAAPNGVISGAFVRNPNSMYYFENFRRDGEPSKRPLLGNILTPLLDQPVTSLPEEIKIISNDVINNYYLGTHYWLVRDVSEYAGTIRARDGIEWSAKLAGDAAGLDPQPSPETLPPAWNDPSLVDPPLYGEPGSGEAGTAFEAIAVGTPIEVERYTYDKNIPDLQATIEAARQITTDVLAHKARVRYFKLDVTVIYDPAATSSNVNNSIQSVLSTYLANQYFGAAINLSDLLQEVHSVSGITNARWTSDVPNTNNEVRVYETDISGKPLLGASVDRFSPGGGAKSEVQELFLAGNPTEGGFTLIYDVAEAPVEVPIEINKLQGTASENASYIQGQLTAKSIATTVLEEVRETVGVVNPIRSWKITFTGTAKHPLPQVVNGIKSGAVYTQHLKGGEFTFANDFFLKDNELPALPTGTQLGDSVPGLVIRPRAQGTWQRAN
jgi:uncharacterized phage protein gp47/JayE